MVCKYFLPFRRLPLHPDCLLCCAEVFYFDIVALVYFCSCCLCFWCSIHGLTEFMEFMDITKTNVMKLAFCNHLCYSERYNETVFLTRKNLLYLPVNSKTVFKLFRVPYVKRMLLSLPTFHHASL